MGKRRRHIIKDNKKRVVSKGEGVSEAYISLKKKKTYRTRFS